MPTKLLTESASKLSKSGNRWRAVLARAGQGTSGFYSEEVLREYGPKALAPGAKAFINHDPKRDPRDMFGTYPDGAIYEEGVGLVGELEVFPHYKELIEAIGLHAALSIYMVGEVDDEGNVTSLTEDIQNGCDLVSYGGLTGSGIVEKLYESAIAASQQTSVEPSADDERKIMELKDLSDKVDALSESVKTAFADFKVVIESLKPIAPAEGEVDFAAVAEAVVAEKSLVPSARKRVFEAVKAGTKLDEALASIKAEADEYKAAFTAAEVASGRIVESAGSNTDLTVEGWN